MDTVKDALIIKHLHRLSFLIEEMECSGKSVIEIEALKDSFRKVIGEMKAEVDMQKYCLAFVFSGDEVLLIKKARPEWQKGLLNGIGGHIEPGESANQAMAREFKEETGFQISIDKWNYPYVIMIDEVYSSIVYIFRQFVDFDLSKVTPEVSPDISQELLQIWNIKELRYDKCISNLRWLIPLALDRGLNLEASPVTVFYKVANIEYTNIEADPRDKAFMEFEEKARDEIINTMRKQ